MTLPLCLVGPGGGDWASIADRACLLFDCSVSAPYNSDSGIGQDSELFDYSDTMEFSQEWVPTAGGLSVCLYVSVSGVVLFCLVYFFKEAGWSTYYQSDLS